MCDYSLEQLRSRDAVVADRLVTTSFPNTLTRGFADVNAPRVAVCLRPGTELAFAAPPRYAGEWMPWPKRAAGTLARFRKINVETPRVHHDALNFPTAQLCLSLEYTQVNMRRCCSCHEPKAARRRPRLARGQAQARICRYAHPAVQGIHRTCEWSRAREIYGACRRHSGRGSYQS